MTIAQKLGLGFGLLILVFVIARLVVEWRLMAIGENVNEVMDVEEPSLAAAYEMESSPVEINQGVLAYLQTGQPRHKREARDAMADFERAQSSYEELADTDRGKELLGQIGPLYTDYKGQANALRGDREKDLSAGMDYYIAKPIQQEDLNKTLRRWVSRKPDEDQGIRPAFPTADPNSAKNGKDILDPAVLKGLRKLQQDGEPDILEELFGMFLEDAEAQIEELKEAVGFDNAPAVSRLSHSLKGSSGSMGAIRMHRVCAGLEKAGRLENLDETKDLLPGLEEEFRKARHALGEQLTTNLSGA